MVSIAKEYAHLACAKDWAGPQAEPVVETVVETIEVEELGELGDALARILATPALVEAALSQVGRALEALSNPDGESLSEEEIGSLCTWVVLLQSHLR